MKLRYIVLSAVGSGIVWAMMNTQPVGKPILIDPRLRTLHRTHRMVCEIPFSELTKPMDLTGGYPAMKSNCKGDIPNGIGVPMSCELDYKRSMDVCTEVWNG